MNLEIAGRHAFVCAASKGLGKACAMALALEGVNVTINARNREALESAAVEIQHAAGIPVNTVACDITTRDGQDAALATPYGQKIETAQRRQRSNIFGLGPVLHNKLAVDA